MLVPQCPTLPSVDGLMMMACSIAIHGMRSPPAQFADMELLVCKCVRSYKLTKCTCIANRLACTDMCSKLQSCSNQKQQEDEDDIVELGDSDDDIDEQFDV